MKIMDEMIIDHTPLADRYLKIYNKKYNNYIKNVKSYTNIYINQHYPRYEHLELNPCLIKSALVYQNLYQKYLKKG